MLAQVEAFATGAKWWIVGGLVLASLALAGVVAYEQQQLKTADVQLQAANDHIRQADAQITQDQIDITRGREQAEALSTGQAQIQQQADARVEAANKSKAEVLRRVKEHPEDEGAIAPVMGDYLDGLRSRSAR